MSQQWMDSRVRTLSVCESERSKWYDLCKTLHGLMFRLVGVRDGSSSRVGSHCTWRNKRLNTRNRVPTRSSPTSLCKTEQRESDRLDSTSLTIKTTYTSSVTYENKGPFSPQSLVNHQPPLQNVSSPHLELIGSTMLWFSLGTTPHSEFSILTSTYSTDGPVSISLPDLSLGWRRW